MRTYALVLFVALSVFVLAESQFIKRCRKDRECRPDECCAGFMMIGGRCERRPKEGMPCSKDGPDGSDRRFRCPCAEGLECVAVNENSFFEMHKCQKRNETVSTAPPDVSTPEVTPEVTSEVTPEVTPQVVTE